MSPSTPSWDSVEGAEGIDVVTRAGRTRLTAHTELEIKFLRNAERFYKSLAMTGVAPSWLGGGRDWIDLEAIEGAYQPGHEMTFLWGCLRLLDALGRRGIIHGDLTAKNILVRAGENEPVAIDFQQARYVDDDLPPKRPESDAWHLWQAAVQITGDRDRRFRRWLEMRTWIERGPLLDVGCNGGYFCAMAAVDSPAVGIIGIDTNVGHIQMGYQRLAGVPALEQRIVLLEAEAWVYQHDHMQTVLCLSTWPYLIEQWGFDEARDWLRSIIAGSQVLLFETQYVGDGPGDLTRLIDDTDCASMLRELGAKAVFPRVSIPVAGRDAARTLWLVI